jgi:hypothetical protein
MTVLSAASGASRLLGKGAISALLTSTDPFHVELVALCDEVATDIAKRHDWNKLLTLKTQAGDGSDTTFDLPSDYDRMPVKAAVFQTSTTRPMMPVTDLDVWLANTLEAGTAPYGEWIIISGQINIRPALGASDSAKFYYVSNSVVDPASGSNHSVPFTLDTDVFVLPERLLQLGLIWRWRYMKGLDYAEDMNTFELALAQEIARDKGSRMFAIGRARIPDDVHLAYPGAITP